MESTSGKYLKILVGVFLTLVSLLLAITVLLFIFKTVFGWLEHIPYFSLIFTLFALLVPVSIFGFAYLVFMKKTRYHPKKGVKWVSYIFFVLALLGWAIIAGVDLYRYFTQFYQDIGKYLSFNKYILIPSVFGLFLFGMIQALSMPGEPDWMNKHNRPSSEL